MGCAVRRRRSETDYQSMQIVNAHMNHVKQDAIHNTGASDESE